LDGLIARGIDAEERVGISGRAHLLLEYHKRLDHANEKARGAARIGTTGKGIGPAYEDKVARRGIRVADLRIPERARELIVEGAEAANQILRAAGLEPVDPERIADELLERRARILPLMTDVGIEIMAAIADGVPVLLEGAQGTLLDLDHGTYPFVTASTTTAAGAATGTGIGPTMIDRVLGVIKAYTTRVGSGPLPSEIEGELGDRLRDLGGEYGATTGRARRCGWFDAVVARHSARVNGLTGLALTKLDVLDTFEEIQIVTGYQVDGEVIEEFPDDLSVLEKATPVLESHAGWQSSTEDARTVEELPARAREYIARIEELTGVPVEYVGVGTRREQIIVIA
jgi:adenylosuccinate synthase